MNKRTKKKPLKKSIEYWSFEEFIEYFGKRPSYRMDIFDLVHDVASREASDINNAGLSAQIAYLIQHLGNEAAHSALEQMIVPPKGKDPVFDANE